MKRLTIAGRSIGGDEPCFIIAEAGVNHNGRIETARRLVDVARQAGADAVKFQSFKADRLVTRRAEKAAYQKETTSAEESQHDMIRKLELTEGMEKELFDYASGKGILFLSTPFDEDSADDLDRLGMAAFKIPSGEITNFSLLRHIAKKGKPVILSTGMATLEEIGEALEVIKDEGGNDILLLHCVTSYPARFEDTNLKAMLTMHSRFNLPVGLSDHTLGLAIPVAAVALGAVAIEKHFTLDRNLPGPDHKASLEPEELRQMVCSVRQVEKAMGDGVKKPTPAEEEIKKVARRSVVAALDIPRGSTITEAMLDIKRPGTGIEPRRRDEIVGATAKLDIKKDDLITWEMIGKS